MGAARKGRLVVSIANVGVHVLLNILEAEIRPGGGRAGAGVYRTSIWLIVSSIWSAVSRVCSM